MYADYNFYTVTYLGNLLSAAEFDRLSTRASDYIDQVTGGKAAAWVQDNPNNPAVKLCCCALAENYKAIDNARASLSSGTREAKSESVGSYSVTYQSSQDLIQYAEAEMRNIVRNYLGNTGLLYRGASLVYSTHCNCL